MLNLFAYGTYKDYLANKSILLELSPAQKKKLQHLTIVTLATKSKVSICIHIYFLFFVCDICLNAMRIPLQCIQYTTLLKELDINNVRDLEDLIIEAVYADIIHGKLDQKNSQLEVDYAIGRDIGSDDINVIVNCLQEWCAACEDVLECVETQIRRANYDKNRRLHRKIHIEHEVDCFIIFVWNALLFLCRLGI